MQTLLENLTQVMTVSIKKRKYPEPKEDYAVKTHCDSCSRELTLKLIFKCAECQDYDLCLDCFCQGKESSQHSNGHKYRILETLDFPIYSSDWYADEELLLLEGLQAFGMGNWEQIAEYIGTKDKDEVYQHYMDVYVRSKSWPLPKAMAFDKEKLRRSATGVVLNVKKPSKIARPSASQPCNHDIQGYMPGRLDFETEFDNDADQHVGAMEFSETDSQEEILLKTAMLSIYNATLTERLERKNFVFSRNLIDFRKIQGIEKKRPKDERELLSKFRVYSRMMNETDFNKFIGGLLRMLNSFLFLEELKLQQRIMQLQEARKMGLTKLSEIATYEKDKANRATNKALGYNSLPYEKPSARSGSGRSKEEPTTPPGRHGGAHRKTPNPLDISQAESYSLLLQGERDLCSTLRIYPKAYFLMKDILLRAFVSRGFLTPSMAKSLIKDVDPAKVQKVYEFFYEAGWVKPI